MVGKSSRERCWPLSHQHELALELALPTDAVDGGGEDHAERHLVVLTLDLSHVQVLKEANRESGLEALTKNFR